MEKNLIGKLSQGIVVAERGDPVLKPLPLKGVRDNPRKYLGIERGFVQDIRRIQIKEYRQ